MSREDKLRKLDKANSDKSKANRDDFFSLLTEKIDDLRVLVDDGISIRELDELITELHALKAFAPAVDELKKTIAEIKIPELPDKVKLDGLDSLTKAIGLLKIPDANITVEYGTDQLDKVLAALDALIKVTQDKKAGQSPSDFVPMRKVVSLNNGKTLIFDDGLTGAHSGGGGGSDGIIHGVSGGSATVTGGKLDVNASIDTTGLATSDNQQPPVNAPTVYNVTLTNANTEYSQALPANTREFRFIARTLVDIRFAWVTGKVATPTAPYLTLPAGMEYASDNDNLPSQTLYLASATAGTICEIEVWTSV